MEDILKINEKTVEDNAVSSYQYWEFNPQNGSNLNRPGEILIHCYPQDEYFHPAESYLLFEGAIMHGKEAIKAESKVTLTNNAMMYLFRMIEYSLNGTTMESLYYPGRGTTMKKLLKNSMDSPGLLSMWEKDSSTTLVADTNSGLKIRMDYTTVNPVPPGTFSCIVYLSDIFGFAENYNKVLYGMRQTIRLVRKGDNDALLRNDSVDYSVNLTKLSFMQAIVKPDDEYKMKLYSSIQKKETISMSYYEHSVESIQLDKGVREFSWKLGVRNTRPRFIIFAMQTDKGEDQTKNGSLFDHAKISNFYALLNAQRYPSVDYDIDFVKMRFARAYRDTMTFFSEYYNVDPVITGSQLSPLEYWKLYSVFAIDLSHQSEKIKEPVIDITLKMFFNGAVEDKTLCYALIMSERLINLQSDGQKFNIVY